MNKKPRAGKARGGRKRCSEKNLRRRSVPGLAANNNHHSDDHSASDVGKGVHEVKQARCVFLGRRQACDRKTLVSRA